MGLSTETNAAALASRFINHTNCHIFLTGKAGTGKTTFLRHIIQSTHKKAVIAAPTGIAAINAGGVTLHSLFQLPFGCFVPVNQTQAQPTVRFTDPFSLIRNQHMNENKRKILREMELLIIDEVSMLRADLLDAIDTVLRHVRKRQHVAFGGVQVLFIGDLLQLPPVVKDDEWNMIRAYYRSAFFFDARVLQDEKPLYVELEKIYRQNDQRFITLLNHLRNNTVTKEDTELLGKYYRPGFKPQPSDHYITLTTHNHKADEINRNLLNDLTSAAFRYDAGISGEFNEYAYPVEAKLELKEGAQVMFVKNDPTGAQRFFNGKIGTVQTLLKDKIEVRFSDTGKTIEVEKYEWENTKYVLNETTNEIEEAVAGTFRQYPLKLAWAITVHKSQGLTFDKAVVDIGQAFAPGQVYVALSRLRSLDGLVLTSPLNDRALLNNNQVMEFAQTKEQQENLESKVEKASLQFLKDYLLEIFDLTHMINTVRAHVDSYNVQKDEKKSAKQKYSKRAFTILMELQQIKPHADNFMNKVRSIFQGEENQLQVLQERVDAAKNYFSPLLWKQSGALIDLMDEVKEEKKIKTYLRELRETETAIYEQIKELNKAVAMINAIAANREFTRSEITVSEHENERLARLEKTFLVESSKNTSDPVSKDEEEIKKVNEWYEKKAKEKKKKEPKPKKEKVDTKLETLKLYREGKTIDEIAAERNYVRSTIETHLAHFISKGELSILNFMSDEQFSRISQQLKILGKFELGILKGIFGDEFTYGQLRMALAGYLVKNDE